MSTTTYDYHASPLGPILLCASGRGLAGLYLDGARNRPGIGADWQRSGAAFHRVKEQLDEYFARERQAFDIPLDFGGSAFQSTVWSALREIRYGETISYGELARRVERPAAVRAVGSANGRNPISIVVPCHRVIAADGSLAAKRHLLELESRFAMAA
jgi:methylated-DNA-[protein]-cysteine S-methyltransferase